MSVIITILWFLIFVSVIGGIYFLFRKGQRLKGLAYITVNPVLLFIGIIIATIIQDPSSPEKEIVNQNHNQAVVQQTKSAVLDKKQNTPVEALKGFPDEKTLQIAFSIGIERFEAYRLLNDVETISQYCSYSVVANKIAETKLTELDAAKDKTAETKIWEKYDKIQSDQLNKFNSKLGLQDLEYLTLANAGHWNWHCRAAEQNWDVFTPAQAAMITFDDARTAKANLEGFYLTNLYEIKMPFIVSDNSLAVSCSIEALEDRHYLGCYFNASGGKISQHIIYTIGKSDDGRVLLSPLNGVASGHAKDLGIKEGGRTFLQGQYSGKVYLARIADSEDISAVLDLF